MMGYKERAFAPVVAVSLEELVPADHFYRQLQRVLDLSFVHDLVREYYAAAGRPSIDPVVFFEDVRSERLLMRLVADRLSVGWYLSYVLSDGGVSESAAQAQSVGRTLIWGGQRVAWHATIPFTPALAGQWRSVSDRGRAKSQTVAQKAGMGTAPVAFRGQVCLL